MEIPTPDGHFLSALKLVPLTSQAKDLVLLRASPVLKQRILMLSDSHDHDRLDWLKYLTWDNSQADALASLLAHAHGIDATEDFLGYGCSDVETITSLFKFSLHTGLETSESVPLYMTLCISVDNLTGGLYWQLYELSLTMSSGQLLARDSHQLRQLSNASWATTRWPRSSLCISDGSDDEYWQGYDKPSETASDPISSSEVASEDYYARYSTIEPALDNKTNERIAPAKELATTDVLSHIEKSLQCLWALTSAAGITEQQFLAMCYKTIEQTEP